jgi:NitT/TauT family transport system substrate-binding protein
MVRFVYVALSLLTVFGAAAAARAETQVVRGGKQYGLGYLQLVVMEDQKLVEKHAKAAGLGDIKVEWLTLGGPAAINDAILSGAADFAAVGPAGLMTIWSKTRGNVEVRGMSGLNAMPIFLVTRNPRIKTLRDYREGDRIALTSVKVAMQAIVLQMAVAKEFGDANYAKLDPLTVSMAHPDAMTALLSPGGEIDSHFSSPPYQYQELERPGVHRVLSSYEVTGEKMSFVVIAAASRFRTQNPKTFDAVFAALEEATSWINAEKRAAAETYQRVTKDKTPIEQLMAMMNDPDIEFTLRPTSMQTTAEFMHRIGTIPVKPASWKDLYFPNIHGANGS